LKSRGEDRPPPDFVPELRLRDRFSLSAFGKAPLQPKPVIVNFCELMQLGKVDLHVAMLRRTLVGASPLILSAVGRDDLLDELDMRLYHKTAIKLRADWVVSPDDYVYEADYGYSFYQNVHFSRALRRTLALVRLARGNYRVVGLAIGSSLFQLQDFVRTTRELGVSTFAYPCGDMLKGMKNAKRTLHEIAAFVQYLKDSSLHSMLLGIDSPRLVRRFRPEIWSSAAWSFDAAHGLHYSSDGKPVRGRIFRCTHKSCATAALSLDERLALHNLLTEANLFGNERSL
jgi:hypothetical protein